jgi:hypothetical protein
VLLDRYLYHIVKLVLHAELLFDFSFYIRLRPLGVIFPIAS